MITMSKMRGNLGNRLFEFASLTGLAKKYGHELTLPEWDYPFKHKPNTTKINAFKVPEIRFEYVPEQFQLEDKTKNFDISGYLQSEKYWLDCKDEILEKLEFEDYVKEEVVGKYGQLFSKPTIAISIRRGDFVGNPNHYLLPASYYYLALLEHFPDWRNYNILIFSDDPEYCLVHFECLKNATIIKDTPVNQMCLGSMCENFIIANSTFSWWMAYLGEKNGGKIIRPHWHFAGEQLKLNIKDHYPKRWINYNHEGNKLSLRDFTFTVPVYYDHPDRKQNMDLSICFLQRDFDTKIIVGENQSDQFGYMSQWCEYVKFDYPEFHRTRMLNEMAKRATTPFIVNWDCDNFIPPLQIYMMAEDLRSGVDMCYPFDGQSARMPRETWFKQFEKHLDCGIVRDTKFMGKNGGKPRLSSVGHAIGFKKQSFIEGGMENEYMISFGPEDVERYERFQRLGYKITRIEGACYHMDHYCGPNSSRKNPHFVANHDELKKIRAMSDKELEEYVHSWTWFSPYTSSYYETITEDAIRSRDEVFKILGIPSDAKIVDCGGGLGQWGVGLPNYTNVDFQIPKDKLLIHEGQYLEHDLRTPLSFNKKFDYVLCLEVAEHIEEKYADQLVENLCGLGDTIIFSAAIPNQGGTGHVNEQFQTYWAKKFYGRGYGGWQPQMDWIFRDACLWYKQNIVVYKHGHRIGEVEDYVLPEYYLQITNNFKRAI